MNLEVLRFSSGRTDTLGLLFDISNGERKFLCYNEWIKEEWPDGSKEKDNQEKNIKSK